MTPAQPSLDTRPLPVTLPRGRVAFVVPLLLAVVLGLGAGASPRATLVVVSAVVSAAVLATRVEWAALAVVCTSVFDAYLSLISPWAADWLVAVLMVAWLVRRAEGPLHDRRLVLAAVPTWTFAAALGLAFVAHPLGRAGLATSAKYAELALVMLVLADVLCGPLVPRRAARGYVLACVAAAVCGVATALVDERHRVVGPVANADTLAFFLIAALPLLGTLRSRADQPVWWVRAGFAALVVAGVGTLSRPAFVALVAMLLVAVLTGLLALRHAGALIAVVLTGVALVIAVLPLPVGRAFTDPQRYSDTNIAQRNDFRLAALDMTRASPVVGLGPGSFPLFHQDHHDVDARARDLDTAYSTALEASAELGVLGLVSLYAVWLVPAVAARRRRDRSRLVPGTLLALGGLLTASLLESEQRVLPLWFLAAMAIALGRPARLRTPIFGGPSGGRSSGQPVPRS